MEGQDLVTPFFDLSGTFLNNISYLVNGNVKKYALLYYFLVLLFFSRLLCLFLYLKVDFSYGLHRLPM